MPKVSEEHKEGVRRRILDAAARCVERSGYQQLTTRSVVDEAGVSNGTLYNYFPTKEHLYRALAEDALRGSVETVDARAEGAPAVERLRLLLSEHVVTDRPAAAAVAMFRAQIGVGSDVDSEVHRLNASVIALFLPLVTRAQRDQAIRPDLDAEALVELVDIVWDGLGRRDATRAFQTSFERVGATLLAVLEGGVYS